MTRVAFVERGRGKFEPAMVAEHALLLPGGELGIGHRHVEPAGAIGRVGAGAVVGGKGNDRAHERGRGHDVERRVGNRRQPPGRDEIAGAGHLLSVALHEGPRCGMIGTQPIDDGVPVPAALQPARPGGEIGLDLLLKMMAVAPQLGSRVPQGMFVMQAEVEIVFPQCEMVRTRVEPLAQVDPERREGTHRRVFCRADPRGECRRLIRDRRAHLLDEFNAPLDDPQRGLGKQSDGLDQAGARVVEKRRDVLQPADDRSGTVGWAPVTAQHQEMQTPQQVRQPETRILRLRPFPLEPPHRDPYLVQEGGAVDLVVEGFGLHFFQRRGEGPERCQVGSERGSTVASIPIIVRRDAGLRGRDGIEAPADVAGTTARAPQTLLATCGLQQLAALGVAQHVVSALGRVKQNFARHLVIGVVAMRLEPVLHVGKPGKG